MKRITGGGRRGMSLNEWARYCHGVASDNGWWDEERNEGELLALVHSEVSEALECLRDGERAGFRVELVDVIIRVLDILGHEGADVEHIMITKCGFNQRRVRRHGKEF